jgi:hypothetical protein
LPSRRLSTTITTDDTENTEKRKLVQPARILRRNREQSV